MRERESQIEFRTEYLSDAILKESAPNGKQFKKLRVLRRKLRDLGRDADIPQGYRIEGLGLEILNKPNLAAECLESALSILLFDYLIPSLHTDIVKNIYRDWDIKLNLDEIQEYYDIHEMLMNEDTFFGFIQTLCRVYYSKTIIEIDTLDLILTIRAYFIKFIKKNIYIGSYPKRCGEVEDLLYSLNLFFEAYFSVKRSDSLES